MKNQMHSSVAPPVIQPFMPMGNMMSVLPTPPTPFFPQPVPTMPTPYMERPMQSQQFMGTCFNCNQFGHLSRKRSKKQ